jgi:hypothetical protein
LLAFTFHLLNAFEFFAADAHGCERLAGRECTRPATRVPRRWNKRKALIFRKVEWKQARCAQIGSAEPNLPRARQVADISAEHLRHTDAACALAKEPYGAANFNHSAALRARAPQVPAARDELVRRLHYQRQSHGRKTMKDVRRWFGWFIIVLIALVSEQVCSGTGEKQDFVFLRVPCGDTVTKLNN